MLSFRLSPSLLKHGTCVLLGIAGILAGCQVNHRPVPRVVTTQPTSRPVALGKPLIDLSKGAAGFPVVGRVPLNSCSNFVSELTAGYAARIGMPTTKPTVLADGPFPHLNSLQIDLSGGSILSSYRPTSLKSIKEVTPVATVKSLSYSACPLHYDDASQSLRLTASDVKLSLIRGRADKAVLVMTDAKEGEAQFQVSLADMNTIVRDATDDNAGRAVFFVRDTKLTMVADNPRSLQSTVEVRGFWLLVPTDITLTGRIDVDKDFNARLSHLSCTGTEVGGPVLASFINAGLKKYDGKVMPLAAFPGNKLKMRDLHIRVDDSLHIDAQFGD